MPAGISNTDLIDLTRTTLENLPSMDFEVALEYQQWNVVNLWFKEDKVQSDGGTSIKRNIVLEDTGNARMVRPYQRLSINVADTQQFITAPFFQMNTHWSIERYEAIRNRGKAKFIPLIQSRRLDAMVSLAELIESKAWLVPTSSSDDLNPMGVPYWLSMLQAAATTDGFNAYTVRYSGGTTSTTKGGIDGSTTPNAKWRNYALCYTAVNADMVNRVRKAFFATGFKSPMMVQDLSSPKFTFRGYMALNTLTEYSALMHNANDNLGPDLAKWQGQEVFRGVPILYTPQLDGVTYSPFYFLNHRHFFPIVEEGNWLHEHEPMSDVEQPNTQTTHVDCSGQFFCNNVRQAGFVGHTVTA